ncbi:MAG: alpha/beta fold hydrolase [Bryobacterales bacterium]|nr:alpha/beta fold hydrolase [Bryobacterales bacterium]
MVADGVVLAHGAGSNCNAQLLVTLSGSLAEAGFTVLRIDLPFRRERPTGPPFPATAARDREGLRDAVSLLRETCTGQIVLGGHSYGGRQATMLAAEDAIVADALLLLSYPLHPPRKPEQLRVAHLPSLRTPSLFVHGTRDPFGSVEELRAALRVSPAKIDVLPVEGAGHDLKASGRRSAPPFLQALIERLQALLV